MEIKEILKTEITDNFELYILCEVDNGYKLYLCNLDVYMDQQVQKLNKFRVEEVLYFTRDQIPVEGNIQIKDMVIRPRDQLRKLIVIFKVNNHIISMVHG